MAGTSSSNQLQLVDRIIFRIVLAVIGLYVLNWIVSRVGGILSWIFIALVLSFAIEPFVNYLAAKGWRRGVATNLALFGITLLGAVLVLSVAPIVVGQISDLVENVPQWTTNVETFLEDNFDIVVSSENIISQAERANINISAFATDITSNLLGLSTQIIVAIFQVLTIALFTFYFVADGPKLRRHICSLLPKDKQKIFLDTWETAIDKTGSYVYSRLLLAIISAVVTFIFLSVVGVPYALSLAVWMGFVSQFIPTIGTYIAAALPLLVALLEEPINALFVLIFITLYQQIENYYIGPQITAKTMQLHPAVALGSVIVGANLGGAMGAILALPVAGILQVSFAKYMRRYDVVDSKLTNDIKKTKHKAA